MRTEGDRAGVLLHAYTRVAQPDGYLRERGRGDSEPPRTPRWRPWERAPDVLKVAERGSLRERRAASSTMRCGSSIASACQLLLFALCTSYDRAAGTRRIVRDSKQVGALVC